MASVDAEYLRKIITSQSEKRKIKKKGFRESPVKRKVRIMDEPVFILRRLVLYIGDQRCALTLLSLNLKLEGNIALEYYLNELMRILQEPGRPRFRKRVKSSPNYSRVVTTENDEGEGGGDREEEKMEEDIMESDLEKAFARAVNIEGPEVGEEEAFTEKEAKQHSNAERKLDEDSSTMDNLEALLSELIEQEESTTCKVKMEQEDDYENPTEA